MKKNLWLGIVFFLSTFCLISCQPGGGDFLPLPAADATVESYNDKKGVVQVYSDEQILLKVRGQWDVEYGASTFYMELTNKSQKDLVIVPDGVNFNTNLDEKIIANEISYTVTGNPPEETSANQKLNEAKPENREIKIKSGQKSEFNKGFYLNIKGFSKNKGYFLEKEVRFDVPIKFEGQAEKVYKFAFKYANHQ